jgi:integrase/recombinase XerC
MIDSFLRYIEFERRLSKNTVLSYATDLGQLRDFLLVTYETDAPHQATFSMLRSWIAQLVEAGTQPRSVNRKIASLRSFFTYLLRQGVVEKDPTLKLKVLKTQKRLPTFVKSEELNTVLDSVFTDDFESWRDKLVMELLYGTGMRLSELLGLTDHAINLRAMTIRVLGKRNKERVIPIGKNLVPIITGYQQARNRCVTRKENNLLLVTETGEPAYKMLVQRTVKKYLNTTHAEKKSPHVLRHTYATHLLNQGAEINAVKDLLGHSSLAATQVYTHNTMEKLKKTFEQAHPKA